MGSLDVNSETFFNKVYGCWMGKNCGGTLGEPLEQVWGKPEPLDVWWYPELREGGIPNDDLELQLVWLKALEEVGPGLKAADLAHYWLNYVGYNFDEYGLSKTNLRLGLLPPVSGFYNNWFKDCMGCPIRSEIWACVAPGLPRVACRYAYEDAICDHAGGESVYGEMFNVAIESAAFVFSDRDVLLKIGMSYVPEESQTAKAIRAALSAHAEGVTDWKEARRRVLAATPHHVGQYSPINMAFQVIGWLYGKDFGDAICIAVNCGYDTDCTGATLGSILGIVAQKQGLPEKWTKPLGDVIATNESWGGLRHVSQDPNPVPQNLTQLTDRVILQARRVLAAHGYPDGQVPIPADPAALYADDGIRALWKAPPLRVDFAGGTMAVGIEYDDSPAVVPGVAKTFTTHLTNTHPDPLPVRCGLHLPRGWTSDRLECEAVVPAKEAIALDWRIIAPATAAGPKNSATAYFSIQAAGRPAQPAVPVTFIGASKFRRTSLFPAAGRTDQELFDVEFAPEQAGGANSLARDGREGDWAEIHSTTNALPLSDAFAGGAGVVYLQTFLWNPGQVRDILLHLSTSVPSKMWLGGEPVAEPFDYKPLRPNHTGKSSKVVSLPAGWSEVLMKFVKADDAVLAEAHLLLSSAVKRVHDGLPEIGRTRLPWDGA